MTAAMNAAASAGMSSLVALALSNSRCVSFNSCLLAASSAAKEFPKVSHFTNMYIYGTIIDYYVMLMNGLELGWEYAA